MFAGLFQGPVVARRPRTRATIVASRADVKACRRLQGFERQHRPTTRALRFCSTLYGFVGKHLISPWCLEWLCCVCSQTRLGPGPRQQGRQVQEVGCPTLAEEAQPERKGRSAAEVCTSAARKIGVPLAARQGRSPSRYRGHGLHERPETSFTDTEV